MYLFEDPHREMIINYKITCIKIDEKSGVHPLTPGGNKIFFMNDDLPFITLITSTHVKFPLTTDECINECMI